MKEKFRKPKIIIGAAAAGGLLLYLAVHTNSEGDNTSAPPRHATVQKGEKVYSHPGDAQPCGTVIKPFKYGAMESEPHGDHLYDRYSNQLSGHTEEIVGRDCDEYWVLRPATPRPSKVTPHAMGITAVHYVQL